MKRSQSDKNTENSCTVIDISNELEGVPKKAKVLNEPILEDQGDIDRFERVVESADLRGTLELTDGKQIEVFFQLDHDDERPSSTKWIKYSILDCKSNETHRLSMEDDETDYTDVPIVKNWPLEQSDF